jgi:ABC-2 type transport system permease protein
MIITIALRELRSMFVTPLAWIVLATTQIVLSLFFFFYIDKFLELLPTLKTSNSSLGVTDIVVSPLLDFTSFVMLIVTPFMTMRLISAERSNRSICLLLSAPVSNTEIILGKYLSSLLFILIFMFMVSLMPLSLLTGSELDLGKIASGFLGLTLLLATYASVGLFFSSLTSSTVISAISTFGFLFFLLILKLISSGPSESSNALAYLSTVTHLTPFLRGIVDSKDVIYFLLFISTFILLSIKQMDSKRLQG